MALTVDVEGSPRKLGARLDRLLELFAAAEAKATFFMLGELVDAVPEWVTRLTEAGHEIGFHGFRHVPVGELTPGDFSTQLSDGRRRLEDLSQRPVRGFRAPFFSIDQKRSWALRLVAQAGFSFDSSINPGLIGRFGWFGAPWQPVRLAGTRLTLFPLPLLSRWIPLAYSGGGYLRLLPWSLILWGFNRQAKRGEPGMVYLHPWELDSQTRPSAPGWHGRVPSWLAIRQEITGTVGRQRTGPRLANLLERNRGRLYTMGQLLDSIKPKLTWDPDQPSHSPLHAIPE